MKVSEKLMSKSLAELVRDEVMRLIAKGELQPGDRLNEVHLAEAFGISRGPIREAARELEGQDVPIAAAHFPGMNFGRLLKGEGRRRWVL